MCGSGDYVTKYINGFADARHAKYDFLMQMSEYMYEYIYMYVLELYLMKAKCQDIRV